MSPFLIYWEPFSFSFFLHATFFLYKKKSCTKKKNIYIF
jgi:hypothetical protein